MLSKTSPDKTCCFLKRLLLFKQPSFDNVCAVYVPALHASDQHKQQLHSAATPAAASQPDAQANVTQFFQSLITLYAGDPAGYQAAVADYRAAQAGNTKPSSNAMVRSTAKAHQPDTFAGTAAEHGPKALQWVEGFALYVEAEHEPHPVAKAATYLRDAAQDWWHEARLPTNTTWDQFRQHFLARFVKPSDSAKARASLPSLKQGKMSVEEYVTAFRQMNSRVTVGTPVDSTTLASWFTAGLKDQVSNAMLYHYDLDHMQDLNMAMEAAISILPSQAKARRCAKDGFHHSYGLV